MDNWDRIPSFHWKTLLQIRWFHLSQDVHRVTRSAWKTKQQFTAAIYISWISAMLKAVTTHFKFYFYYAHRGPMLFQNSLCNTFIRDASPGYCYAHSHIVLMSFLQYLMSHKQVITIHYQCTLLKYMIITLMLTSFLIIHCSDGTMCT